MDIEKAIHGYYEEHDHEVAEKLLQELFKFPQASLVETFSRCYKEQWGQCYGGDWHFRWFFWKLTINRQIELIEAAVNKAEQSRTAFDLHLLKLPELIQLLNFPRDSKHQVIFKILGFGWYYEISVCKPALDGIKEYLPQVIAHMKSLVRETE